MTVVSQYGKVLAEHTGIDIEVGRFTKPDMVRIIHDKDIELIIDASHPYAAIVSETAFSACRKPVSSISVTKDLKFLCRITINFT